MKRAIIFTLCYLMFLGSAFAGPPGSPVGGGGGGGTPDDDSVTSAKIVDNTVTVTDIKCTGTKDNTTYLRMDGTCSTPAGSGDMTKAVYDTGDNAQVDNAALADNVVAGALVNANIAAAAAIDATKIADGTVTSAEFQYVGDVTSAIQAQLDGKSPTTGHASIATVGTITSGTWNATDVAVAAGGTGASTAADARTNLGLGSSDNVTHNTVTATEFISSATDNTRGTTVPNTSDPTGANLAAGKCWYDITNNTWDCRNGDNTVTTVIGAQVKTFPFGIDNVIDGDDILLWKLARAITITQVDCYASTDNVVGVLTECASDNVTSCTAVDDTDWTVTNAVTGFSANSGFENAGIAADAWLKWITTSEGTTNSNKLSCTVRYRE